MTRQPKQIAGIAVKSMVKVFLGLLFFCISFSNLMAQTTSWKGTTSTSWSTSSNWTNGVPTSAVDAIIGDASFTGSAQPSITVQASCKSLTIGSGTKSSTLLVDKALTIAGNLVIGANGTINHSNTSISVKGNWTNSGTYTAGHVSSSVVMAGTTQSITGTATFRKLTINAGSTTTLNNNIVVNKAFTVTGILDPQTYLITLAGSSFAVSPGATLKVKASTFAGNYSINPTLSAESTVDYASASIAQTIAALTYSTLKISGSTTKTLAANTTLMSSTAATGNVNVTGGTLDLAGKTLNRGTSVAGGSITVGNGAFLKIGGTVSFPSNFATSNLAVNSTVEYNGTNQTVSNQPYGNLVLSSSSGSATKTMPGTAMTIANDLTSSMGSGSVSFTAGASITVNGVLTIGSSTTFAGGSYSHTIAGNWVNNGTFTAGTSTIILSGTNKTISGTSTTIFNNLSITGLGISTSSNALTVAGNMSTSGAGTFTHTSGTLTMSGASKSISGIDITLNNLTISGSIGTTSSMIVAGNLLVNGSLNATGGTINMNGASKTISGSGTIIFYALRVVGTVSTSNNFSIVSDMSGSGKLTATAGTTTFTGTSAYGGAHDLFNVTLNGTKLQLGANSTLGIANTLTLTAGTFDVTTSVPNTVSFNGSGSQNIPSTTYDNLTTATGGTKTASGALTINNALTISSTTTFSAGSYTHTIKGNWINSGTFTAGSSTIQLTGDNDTSVTGATTFNVLTINKSNSSHYVTLNNNISVPTLNMTTGELHTEAYAVTITTTRTGNGIILGTITRTHAFSSLVAYAFESSYNTITLASILGSVTSITVTVHSASVDDFPLDGSINRIYNYSVTNTGSYLATLRLHYEDDELNGNSESSMMLWKYSGTWTNSGKSSNSTTNNYIENTLISDISGRWTISDNNVIAVWKGTTSSAWETSSNWKSGSVPTSDAIVQIGTEVFTHQPSIASSASAKALTFGSVQASTLTLLSGGTLSVNGNVRGDWTGNATHTIQVGNQTLNVTGDMVLSNGTANRLINLNIGSGTATIGGSLTQAGSAAVVFSDAGTLSIGESFHYTSGTFTAGTGTVVYNGSMSQTVGGAISYYNLSFNKTGGAATFSSPITINGSLTLSTGGVFNLNAALTVAGNVTINSGVVVNEGTQTLTVGGNWARTGTYNSSLGSVTFNGTGTQTIGSTTFYNLIINKSSGTITPTGNITINSGLTVTAGTFDLGTYTVNRSVAGGTITVSAGAILKLSGASNFPGNFNNKTLAPTSTVEYNGSIAQNIAAITFGNLVLSNGGSTAKVLTGSTTVGGNLTINSGSTLNESSYTIILQGDLTNSGGFVPSTGTVVLAGTSKSVNGPVNFNNLIITGSYTAATGSNLIIDGNVDLSGSYVNGTNSISVAGDLLLSGLLSSDGVTTYTGTRQQTLRLTGSITSPSLTHTVIFAGTVAPVLNSTSPPVFVNVIISNTGVGGIVTSVDWTVLGGFQVTSGATFNGGSLMHTFYGPQFNNQGTVLSSGTLYFNPIAPYANSATLALGSGSAFSSDGIVNFGGTKQIIFTGTPSAFDNVIVSNTDPAGITPVGNWTINEEFSVSEGAIFNAGNSLSHILKKDITISGTLNGGSTLITISPVDSVYISGRGAIAFNNLTITGPVFALGDFSIGGNFTDNGVFYSAGSEISFIGSSNSLIGGSVTSVPFETLNIIKSSTAKVTLAKDISDLAELNIISGTLEDAGHAIYEDLTLGGILTVQADAKLKLEITNTLPVFSDGYSFNTTSIIEYGGTTQTIARQPYGNITLSGIGSKSIMTGTTQAVSITNHSTLVMPNASILELSGDWINNGVLQADGSSVVAFAGSGIQNISGSVITDFQNITVSNTASPGVRVESNQNLLNVLTLTTNAVFDADGSNNSAVFTLLSTGDSPGTDAAIAALPAGARVEGKVTVQRYMSKEGINSRLYRYISSPVQNATVADLQNELPVIGKFSGKSICATCGSAANLFYYDETTVTDLNKDKKINSSDGYIKFPTSANGETFMPGRGYSLKVFGDVLSTTLWDLRGNINAGNFSPVSLPVSYTSSGTAGNDGWNLVGNPFPSTIDWNSNGWTKANIENAIYIPDNGSGTIRFATFNGAIGVNGGTRYIATGQAFWVKASGSGTPVLTANENVKSGGTRASFFREGAPQNMLRITLVKGTITDETVIHFRDDATAEFDAGMDARKMMNSSINLSSFLNDGSFLAINSLPEINCETVVRLSVDNVKAGTHQLIFTDMNSFSNGAIVSLKDKFTNSTIAIAEGTAYSFSVTSNTASFGSNRFEMHFSTNKSIQDFTALAPQVCEGSSGSIEITNSQPYVTYLAKINEKIISSSEIGTGTTIALTIDKQYITTGTNIITVVASVTGCTSLSLTKDISLAVNEIPQISAKSVASCIPASLELTIQDASIGTYSWYETESSVTPLQSNTASTFITPFLKESKTYYVSTINASGCKSKREPVQAVIGKLPEVIITVEGNTLTSSYETGNQWFFNGIQMPDANQQVFSADESGLYSLTVTQSGCSASAEYAYIVMADNSNDVRVSVFPNPVVSTVNIEIQNSTEFARAVILNMSGQAVETVELSGIDSNLTAQVDMTNYQPGLYIIRIRTADKLQDIKVIKN